MSKLDKDSVIEKFTTAYTKANGKAPEIEAKGGWYSVDGGKNIRLAQLDELADELAGGASDAPTSEVKTEKAPAKKAEPKTKAVKKPAKKPAKKSAQTFNVKDFYASEVLANKPGSRSPR